MGVPVEVKGCRELFRVEVRENGRTRTRDLKGKFVIYLENHKELVKARGLYAFIVWDGDRVRLYFEIPARRISGLIKRMGTHYTIKEARSFRPVPGWGRVWSAYWFQIASAVGVQTLLPTDQDQGHDDGFPES